MKLIYSSHELAGTLHEKPRTASTSSQSKVESKNEEEALSLLQAILYVYLVTLE
ncbi:hypothetical protein BDV32DRAFT_154759 [Aspergillus pseudonomiae]|uniref:Uncharacterized protein n=1 Tax=Aspergillus pseudonomiae TaxID=1506151 RepID=A0A5N7DIT4_9EURO|nr:uncharacterized protein BDV37DRAFT_280958 [Aspergillus pseudonomiae]KAB8254901.1 hypothetical protein BDV32DRAFT_154759 [Aspergillus pseudonomiae]KAE8406366.1 hypothetical protein BDV37DRAFT_280958 [Aspergillus pseudonomiae]